MPDEPERYDLDEMMDRLKRRPKKESSDDGELVTRSDGSQAVKVRRRKRRSRQPHKDRQRRVRMLQLSVLMVLALVVVLAIGFVTIYVNSAPFRKQVIQKVSITSGADVELEQFRMNPSGARASKVELEWPAGNFMKSLMMRSLNADASPLAALTGNLVGDEVSAHVGSLVLRMPEDGQPDRVVAKSKDSSPVQFAQLKIKDLGIETDGQSPAFRISGSEAMFVPKDGEQSTTMRMSGGDIQIRNWPDFRLDRAYIEFENRETKVVGLSLQHASDDSGEINLSGSLTPFGAEPNALDLELKSFFMDGLVGGALGRVMQGRVDSIADQGDCKLQLTFGDTVDAELLLAFTASEGESFEILNLPCLYALSQTLGDEWFSRPEFRDVARGQLRRSWNQVELSSLEFASKNRMALRGHLKQEGANLGGKLEIGVAQGMIEGADNPALNAMFSELKDGYRWIEVEITGTAAKPVDNFSQLYEAAVKLTKQEPQVQEGPEPEPEQEGSAFDELTRPR